MKTKESDDVEDLLSLLDKNKPASPAPPQAGLSGYESPTLTLVEKLRRPNPPTVCGACPHSMWFASKATVKCYCRLMHSLTWTSEEPIPILQCDGVLLGVE